MELCNNKIRLLIPNRFSSLSAWDYRDITVRCGSAAVDADGVIAPQGRYCPDHEVEAKTDVRCPRCGVGGFKQYQLHDHYLVDCE